MKNTNADSNEQSQVLFEDAEKYYTKLLWRYYVGAVSIVFLYGVILILQPITDALHGEWNINQWLTLFKAV